MKEVRVPGLWQGLVLLLPITMSVMGISVLTPIVPLLLSSFAANPADEYLVIGGVITMPAVWMLIFSPIAGWMADKMGRRNLLVYAMIGYAFVGVAPAFLNNLYLIIASRVGVGICESIVATVSTTMIGDFFKGRARERWYASQSAVASVTALGIIYLGGELGAAYGWRGPFYLYGYSAPLALLVWFSVWEPDRSPGSSDFTGSGDVDTNFSVNRIIGICLISLLASLAFYAVITKNAQALNVFGVVDPAQIGRLTMLGTAGVATGTFIYWRLSRLSIHHLLFIDFFLVGAGFVFMGLAKSPTAYVVASFCNQLGCGLLLPSVLVWATRGASYRNRGRINGVFQAAFALGQFLSGILITLLSRHLGGLLPTFVVMGGCLLCFAFAAEVMVLVPHRNSSTESPN